MRSRSSFRYINNHPTTAASKLHKAVLTALTSAENVPWKLLGALQRNRESMGAGQPTRLSRFFERNGHKTCLNRPVHGAPAEQPSKAQLSSKRPKAESGAADMPFVHARLRVAGGRAVSKSGSMQ
jgi:hypothetical protein